MLSSRVWWLWVSCASPWESPDKGARHVSSWGIRMKLLRIATRGIAHSTRGRILSGRRFNFLVRHVRILWSDISHPAPDAGWKRRAFQLPRSDMSRSSGSAYPVRQAQLQCSPEASRYFRPTFWDILFRYLLSKSPNSPCNPPIIGFLSR